MNKVINDLKEQLRAVELSIIDSASIADESDKNRMIQHGQYLEKKQKMEEIFHKQMADLEAQFNTSETFLSAQVSQSKNNIITLTDHKQQLTKAITMLEASNVVYVSSDPFEGQARL